MSKKLENYLRAHRKRASLSQNEAAFLLGTRSGTKVSRYEKCVRRPPLRVALRFAIIYRTSVNELFAGIEERERIYSATRARDLITRLEKRRASRPSSSKVATLRALAESVRQA